jgi:hypothetical protein
VPSPKRKLWKQKKQLEVHEDHQSDIPKEVNEEPNEEVDGEAEGEGEVSNIVFAYFLRTYICAR